MKKTLLILTVFITFNSFAQNTSLIGERVFKSSEIVFYGYDYSHFKLAEAKRMYTTDLKKYIPAWMDYLNEEMDQKKLEKLLSKDKVTLNFAYTLSLIDSINYQEIITLLPNKISPDSIQSIINAYVIDESQGIGFVVIVECFEKATEMATAYFVFFDLQTKMIIMSDHYGVSKPKGYGLTSFWGTGLKNTFRKYISKVYKVRQSNVILD